MKTKFNLKLTASLVSLFIALVLVIVGNKNRYCLSFGFILLGVAIALFAFYQLDRINAALIEINNEIEDNQNDEFAIKQLLKESVALNKKKRSVSATFFLCAALLVVVGFSFGI